VERIRVCLTQAKLDVQQAGSIMKACRGYTTPLEAVCIQLKELINSAEKGQQLMLDGDETSITEARD